MFSIPSQFPLSYRGHLVLVPQTLHLVLILLFFFFPLSVIAGNEQVEAGERTDQEKMFARTVELAFNGKFAILLECYRKRLLKIFLFSEDSMTEVSRSLSPFILKPRKGSGFCCSLQPVSVLASVPQQALWLQPLFCSSVFLLAWQPSVGMLLVPSKCFRQASSQQP